MVRKQRDFSANKGKSTLRANGSLSSFVVSPGRVCPRGQVFSDCVSSCPPTCTSPHALGPASAMGQCREECVGGCECPPGLYLHQGRCLKRDDCPCFHRRRTYQPGERIQQRCNTWYGCFRGLLLSFTQLSVYFMSLHSSQRVQSWTVAVHWGEMCGPVQPYRGAAGDHL